MRPPRHQPHHYNGHFFYISKETVFYTLVAVIGFPIIWFFCEWIHIKVPIWGLIVFLILVNPNKTIFLSILKNSFISNCNAFVICFICIFFFGTTFVSLLVSLAGFFISCSLISNKTATYRLGSFTVVVIMASSTLGAYNTVQSKAVVSVLALLVQVLVGFLTAVFLNLIYYFFEKKAKKI